MNQSERRKLLESLAVELDESYAVNNRLRTENETLRMVARRAAYEIEGAAGIIEHPTAEPSALYLRRIARDLIEAAGTKEGDGDDDG